MERATKLPEYEGEYIPLYISTVQGDLTPSEADLFSMVQGLSASGMSLKRTYKDIQNLTSYSKSTLSRSMTALEKRGKISRRWGARSKECNTDDKAEGFHIREHLWTFTTLFEIDGVERRLKASERRVFALIYTILTVKKEFTATVEGIAERLNLAQRTVSAAIRALLRAKLIIIGQAAARNRARRYYLHRRVKIKRGNGKKRLTDEQKKIVSEKEKTRIDVEAANERVDRERYYENLRYIAEHEAERNKKKAFDDPDYLIAYREYSEAVQNEAKAAVFNPSAVEEWRLRRLAADKKRRQALRFLGMALEDLDPYYTCKKCSDTGFRTDGRICDCYKG